MAHEISHSFDELGNIYDAEGRLGLWCTTEDTDSLAAAAITLRQLSWWRNLTAIARSSILHQRPAGLE